MARRMRAQPGAFGFVGANGGFLSKYSTGVYSTTPADWKGFDSKALQAEIDGWSKPAAAPDDADAGVVETYTIDYSRDPYGVLVCRTPAGERFVAAVEDAALVKTMIEREPLGARVATRRDDKGRRVAVSLEPAG